MPEYFNRGELPKRRVIGNSKNRETGIAPFGPGFAAWVGEAGQKETVRAGLILERVEAALF
jgi:hypothetical protein